MDCKDISFSTPEENLLFDEVLLHCADKLNGEEVLRFWESPSLFVVLGRICKVEEDVNLINVRAKKIPVLRRFSGGGTVVQGPGCLNYSLILSKKKRPDLADLRKSYAYILEKVIAGLATIGINAVFRPISDLALSDGEKKFSGNAQHRGRDFILHHGTILYNFDLNIIAECLNMPKDVPVYRQGRPHLDFVTNISTQSQKIKRTIAQEFEAETEAINSQEENVLKEFLLSKKSGLYSSVEEF